MDLAETMVASADGLVYEPVSLMHIFKNMLPGISPLKTVLILAFSFV